MKNLKTILLSIVLITFGYSASAQVPEGFNYMAIARDGDEKLITNTDIQVKIEILDADMTMAWGEIHDVTTSSTGLFQLVIGDPSATLTSPPGYKENFSDIDWAQGTFFVSTSVSLESGTWIPTGTAQLFSVPYAMVSQKTLTDLDNPFTMNDDTIMLTKSVDVVGNYATTEDDALFEVKRQDGQTMFAVYNQGVRINIPMVDNVPKGVKGGFAIGGFGTSKTDYRYDLFTLNKDSVRIYLDKSPDLAKKPKGGFAIGGFEIGGKEPLPHQNYLFIAPDSARIYVKDSGKGVKGGFAIGGFSGSKTGTTNFMDITPKNYFIGHESGKKITTGLYNSVVGYQAGKSLKDGDYNTIIGNLAGTSLTSGDNNIIIGDNAGYSMTTAFSNTVIGYRAGYSLTDQVYNMIVGHESGLHLNSPDWSGGFNAFFGVASGWAIRTSRDNTFLGINAGMFLDNGSGNVFVGTDAGRAGPDPVPAGSWVPRELTASSNTFVGTSAGYNNLSGNNNVAIGWGAGYNITTGTGNVFIGYSAGDEETGSNTLYINNAGGAGETDPPLIYGNFTSGQIGLGTISPAYKLDVVGDVNITGNFRVNGTPIPTSFTTGDLTATGPVSISPTRQVVGGAAVISIADASTWEKGAVMLSNKYDGTDELLATTEKALSEGLATKVTGEGGTISLFEGGRILEIVDKNIALDWDYANSIILISNKLSKDIGFWWKAQRLDVPDGLTGFVEAGQMEKEIIIDVNVDLAGFEIHFGPIDGSPGWSSVWLQYSKKYLVGHYIKY